jgi:phage terminase small subunit
MPDQKGSKPLKNAKHERFAQGLVEGLTADRAYERAGYKRNRKNVTRLKTNEDK